MSNTAAGRRTARGGRFSWVTESESAPRLGRSYFAVQAIAGGLWWACVCTVPAVRDATLGGLAPAPVAIFDLPLFVVTSVLAACGIRWAMRIAVVWTLLVATGLAAYAAFTGLAGWGALLMVAAAAGGIGAMLLIDYRRIPAELILRGALGFRTARSASIGGHLRRTLVQLSGFWILFLAVLPALIRLVELRWRIGFDFHGGAVCFGCGEDGAPPSGGTVSPDSFLAGPFFGGAELHTAWPGAVVLILASALGLWAAVAMSTRGDGTPLPAATANRLVVAGPYRFVRNPMAVAGIAQAIGVGLLLGSWPVVLYALCGAVYWDRLVRPYEEADLVARFGEPYKEYRARVDCWIPRLAPMRSDRSGEPGTGEGETLRVPL